MKNNYKKISLITILFLIILIYTMFFVHCQGDEIWEYGFGYNISEGLIPYRDFNIIVTPLFPCIIALFIKIFGPYLLSAHIFNVMLLILMISMIYKTIGEKTLIIIPLIFCSLYNINPNYNNLITFLTVLLIYINKKNIKKDNRILLSGTIISLMVLTKQSIGIVFFALELFLTKNKSKYMMAFSIPIGIFIIYLIINKALYNFIDYSILGMFDFADSNSHLSFWFIVFIIMCITLIYLYKKSKNNNILYALAFMSMCVPIFDVYHLQISLIIFVFIILLNIKFPKNKYKYFFVWSMTWSLFMINAFNLHYNNEIIIKDNNLLLGRVFEKDVIITIYKTSEIIDKYKNNYNKVYLFTGPNGYLLKLLREEPINKYDIINNGNIGYKGAEKYINEIEADCKSNQCLFVLVPYNKDNKYDQSNHQIIDYVLDNYKLLEENKYFYFYSN